MMTMTDMTDSEMAVRGLASRIRRPARDRYQHEPGENSILAKRKKGAAPAPLMGIEQPPGPRVPQHGYI